MSQCHHFVLANSSFICMGSLAWQIIRFHGPES